MHCKQFTPAVPLALFVSTIALFVLNQRYGFDIYHQHYYLSHALWGLAWPLAFGYLWFDPRQITKAMLLEVSAILRANPFWAWPLALIRTPRRQQYTGKSWNAWAGALWVLFFSIRNEVFVDPVENGVPFTQAYHHLLADIAGIGLFVAICWLIIRPLGATRLSA